VQALGLQDYVFFRGYLDPKQAEQFLAEARAVVMPSLGGEVFGLVALENMLRKKVLIVSEIGALTEVVGDAGLAFPAGDALGLARCLRQVLHSQEFSAELETRAIRRATSLFTPECMVNEHLALYQKIVDLECCPLAFVDAHRARSRMWQRYAASEASRLRQR